MWKISRSAAEPERENAMINVEQLLGTVIPLYGDVPLLRLWNARSIGNDKRQPNVEFHCFDVKFQATSGLQPRSKFLLSECWCEYRDKQAFWAGLYTGQLEGMLHT